MMSDARVPRTEAFACVDWNSGVIAADDEGLLQITGHQWRIIRVMRKSPVRRATYFLDKFWSKVDASGGPDACWPWTRGTRNHGYGCIGYKLPAHRMRSMGAHRVALILAIGEDIPDGRSVLHACDNPPCCNPAHLRVGTHADNTGDALARGRIRGAMNARTAERIRLEFCAGSTIVSLAKKYDVTRDSAEAVVSGHRKSQCGMVTVDDIHLGKYLRLWRAIMIPEAKVRPCSRLLAPNTTAS